MSERKNMTLSQFLEEIQENICSNFCEYRHTVDENCKCDYIRDGTPCPLDFLS